MQVKQNTINNILFFSKKYPIFFGFFLMIVSGFFIFISIKAMIPPPHIVTKYRIQVLETEIRKLFSNNPENKIDIQHLISLKINIKDGWGEKIILENKAPNHYKLISFGEDKTPGGKPDIMQDIFL